MYQLFNSTMLLALVSNNIGILWVAMEAATLPSRSYMIVVAAKLATAWMVIALTAGLIQNRFIYRVVATWAWTLAALSILAFAHILNVSGGPIVIG